MVVVEITKAMERVLRRYADREITRRDAATALKLSERQVSRLMKQISLGRVKSERAQLEEGVMKRHLAKVRAAQDFLAGKLTIEAAAMRAGCHERTISRYAEKISREREASRARRKRR